MDRDAPTGTTIGLKGLVRGVRRSAKASPRLRSAGRGWRLSPRKWQVVGLWADEPSGRLDSSFADLVGPVSHEPFVLCRGRHVCVGRVDRVLPGGAGWL